VNEKPLALVVEASKRSDYFFPLVPSRTAKGQGLLIGALVPGVQKCREFATALSARAMLRLGEGRYAEAWQDLLACHRLGRLVARGGSLIEGLVGIAIEGIATNADLAFAEHARLNAKQLQECLRDLQKLPPMPALVDKIGLCERFTFLDVVMMLAREGPESLEGLSGGPPKKADPQVKQNWEKINWDPALSSGNRWFDRIAAAMRIKDRRAREKQLDQIEFELKALRAKTGDPAKLAAALLLATDPPKALGSMIGDVLVCLLVPAVRKVQSAWDRTEQQQHNLHLVFALAAYRGDHGRYPAKLSELAPKYLAQVPDDLFSGKALIYQPVEGGYLLYSVGVNGRDEGGRWQDDDPPGDDLRVRVPLPKLPQK
jgi:hypothetical protein